MLAAVKATIQYIDASSKADQPLMYMEGLIQAQKAHLKAIIAIKPVELEEATACINVLNENVDLLSEEC